ncbi:MAG: hemerythrin-like domain-containing protein [Gammaproteobacteria bacterium]|jgi:hemerythrin-like domain-containing protein
MATMTRLIQSLCDDHAEMHQLLRSIKTETELLTDNSCDPDYYRLAETVRCFVHLPDVYHHPIENRLFDYLLKQNHEYRGIITRLKYEHLELSKHAKHLYLLLDGVRTGHIVSRLELLHDTHNFISDQTAHMALEEDQVFMLCSPYLETQKWMQFEREMHERFDTDAVSKVKSEFQWLSSEFEINPQRTEDIVGA